MSHRPGSAPAAHGLLRPLRRSGGVASGRRLFAAAAGTLLANAFLVVAACGSTNAGVGAQRQLDFGVAMAQRGLWSEALFRFERARELEPASYRVLNNLAVAYEANGRFDDALATYRRALALDPANRELRRNYARFVEFYQSFRPEEAAEAGAGEELAPEPAAAPAAAEPAPPPPPAVPPGAPATDPGSGKDIAP